MALLNTALVFIKPHAVTESVVSLVESVLADNRIRVDSSGVLSSEDIRQRRIIDKHYSTIYSYAIEKQPASVRLTADGEASFLNTFGVSFHDAVNSSGDNGVSVINAAEAVEAIVKAGDLPEGKSAAQVLSEVFAASTSKARLAPGLYAACVTLPGSTDPTIVINGFYPSNREKFTAPGKQVRWFVVRWRPQDLSWADFRGKVIGPTDPSKAPEGSLRRLILKDWETLGLSARPDVSDNGVHASAGPLEGLAERRVWLRTKIGEDPFGRVLKAHHGLTERFIAHCCSNPTMELDVATGVAVGEGAGSDNLAVVRSGPVFDLLEDMQSSTCGAILQRAFAEDRQARMENTALVFIKPHAVNPLVAGLVEAAFKENGMRVVNKGVRSAREISNGNLIDTHYSTISNFAMNWRNDLERSHEADACVDEARLAELEAQNPLYTSILDTTGQEGLKAVETKFSRLFAEPLDYAVKSGRLMSASSALSHLKVVREHTKNAFLSDYARMSLEEELYDRWNKAETFMKLTGGAYVKEIVIRTPNKDEEPSPVVDHTIPSIFVVNGFYPHLRQGYVSEADGSSSRAVNIMWFVVAWRESTLSWKDFRGRFIGCTDPSAAPDGSLRGAIYSGWKELGLPARPNTSDNGVHASAGPLEGLVERYVWSVAHPASDKPRMPPLPVDEVASYLHHDPVGQLLTDHEIDPEVIGQLCANPMVTIGGDRAPVFEHTEDMQTSLLPQLVLRYLREKKERETLEEEMAVNKALQVEAQARMVADADSNQRVPAVNSAVLLIKPHVSTDGTTDFLREKLLAHGVTIVSECSQSSVSTSTVRLGKTVDAHFGDTAVYATGASPKDLRLTPEGKAAFARIAGVDYLAKTAGKATTTSGKETTAWDQAVLVGQVVNAERALLELGSIKPAALAARWEAIPADKKVEIAFGVVVGLLEDAEMFVINGHYPHLRDSFISEAGIHIWAIQWREEDLSWNDLREGVVGCKGTLSEAPDESLVGFIRRNWRSLGIAAIPSEDDPGVLVSTGPLRALVERRVWLQQPLETDPFALECLSKRGVPREVFQAWMNNEEVTVNSHLRGRAFELLEDRQTSDAANIIADAAEYANMALIPMKKVTLTPKRRLFSATLQDRFIHINTMSSEEEVRDLFDHYDRDKSGFIDRREFLTDFLHFEQYGQPLQQGKVRDLFTKFDRNKDGRLSFDEFYMVMLERVAHM